MIFMGSPPWDHSGRCGETRRALQILYHMATALYIRGVQERPRPRSRQCWDWHPSTLDPLLKPRAATPVRPRHTPPFWVHWANTPPKLAGYTFTQAFLAHR